MGFITGRTDADTISELFEANRELQASHLAMARLKDKAQFQLEQKERLLNRAIELAEKIISTRYLGTELDTEVQLLIKEVKGDDEQKTEEED